MAKIAGLLETMSCKRRGASEETDNPAEFTMTTPSINRMTDKMTTP
jgi:hypothetical protein